MSSARDPHSILNRRPELGGFQVPPPKAKITRYFPGKAPDWQKDNDSDDDIFPSEPDLKSLGGTSITSDKLNKRLTFLEEDTRKDKKIEERVVVRSEKVVERKSNAQNIHKEKKDKLEKDQTNEKIESNEKNITKDLKLNQSGVEIVGEIDVVDRRAALKARLLAKEQETVKAVQAEKNEKNAILERNTIEKIEIEEEEDDNEEEIVEEYEENEGGLFNILKPIYVKKDERSGINDKQVVSL